MTELPAFYSAALDTVSAMKLFVHVASVGSTAFSSALKEVDGELCPVIQFQGNQANGTLTRSPEGLTITMIPDPKKASDFVPRTMFFREADYVKSAIMLADHAEILQSGGQPYSLKIAKIISEAFLNASVFPSKDGGEHTFLVGKVDRPDVSSSIDNLARDIDRLCGGEASCLIAHPALDQPADCLLIDHESRPLEPQGSVASVFPLLREASQKLPNALRITQQGAAYPLPYRIYPHRFTLEVPSDSSMSATRGLIARATLTEIESQKAQFHFAIVPLDPTGEFEAEEAASLAAQQLQYDWSQQMGKEPAPQVSEDFQIEDERIDGRLSVRLTLVVDPKAAERYSLSGRYDLIPE